MKIAHVCPFYTPAIGGVKQVVEELAHQQVSNGHEVHVFTSDWDKNTRISKKYEVIGGVHVHRMFHVARIANFATVWPGVFPALLHGKFDVIHSHVFGHVHFVLSAFAARLSGAVHVHTTHCPWTDAHRSFFGRIGLFFSYNFFSRIAALLTHRIIAITPWENNFIRRYGGSQKRIRVIPNGMNKLFFKRIPDNSFKKRHKISGKMVLFFGRLNVTKGPERYVDIAKNILKKRSDVTFVICGPDEGMLSEVKRRIGSEKRILLLDPIRGNRKRVIEMYQAADVFVLPSFREGLPLTLFEAMASGLPVVASPVNGIPYEMDDGKNGFLVEYGDDNSFEKKIVTLLDDPKLRKKFSQNNLDKARRYQWDLICKQTEEVYLEVLKK